MKIITWNCNMAFRKKAKFILTHKPDILIIVECEHPDKLLYSDDTPKPKDSLWFGENQNKEQIRTVTTVKNSSNAIEMKA